MCLGNFNLRISKMIFYEEKEILKNIEDGELSENPLEVEDDLFESEKNFEDITSKEWYGPW